MDRDREGGGDSNFKSASNSDGSVSEASRYYQPPVVKPIELDNEMLHRVKRNDPGVAGLCLRSNNWIKRAGDTIGNNTILQIIRIFVQEQDINARS